MATTKKKSKTKKPKGASRQVHPWRECPYGQHWVRTHPLHVPPSHNFPDGHVTTRHAHCARNPSGKDELYPDEIQKIAEEHFSGLKRKPCPLKLGFGNRGREYDDLIAGWTQYWNDVFKPAVPLNPDIVKALIATESGFRPKKLANEKRPNSARGLTQITNDTRKILDNSKGELKDHFITVTRDELNDPSVNICAGVRWLFQKQTLASARLDRNATWEEAVAEYKGALKDLVKGQARAKELMARFDEKLKDLKLCKKP